MLEGTTLSWWRGCGEELGGSAHPVVHFGGHGDTLNFRRDSGVCVTSKDWVLYKGLGGASEVGISLIFRTLTAGMSKEGARGEMG